MEIKLWMLMCVGSLTFLSETNGSSDNITNSQKLFGSKMCAFLCRRTTGCSQVKITGLICFMKIMESGVMCASNRPRILRHQVPTGYTYSLDRARNKWNLGMDCLKQCGCPWDGEHVSGEWLSQPTSDVSHCNTLMGDVACIDVKNMYDAQCCPKCYKVYYIRRRSTQCVASSTDGTTEHSTTSQNVGTTERGHDPASTETFFPPMGRGDSPVVTAHSIKDRIAPAPSRRNDPKVQADLIRACRKGDLPNVKLILSEGRVDINFFKSYQKPPVMMAARWGHADVVEFLVNEGADLSPVDQFGNNILHSASIGGNVKIVKCLLSQNVLDINGKGHHRKTPLMIAAFHRRNKVMDLLVREGADVSLVDDAGNNVLHCACLGGNTIGVHYLLLRARGLPDTYARNMIGKTAADLARDKGFHNIGSFLASRGVYQ